MATNPDKSPAPADTRNAFDKAAEQSTAAERLRHLTIQDQANSGRAHLAALAHVKAAHPRLHAISEARWEDDAALAAAGHADPLEHLRD